MKRGIKKRVKRGKKSEEGSKERVKRVKRGKKERGEVKIKKGE